MRFESDTQLLKALKWAEANGPCIIVFDTIYAMEIAANHLRRNGRVFVMRASQSSDQKYGQLKDFDKSEYTNSYLLMNRALADHGFRLTRKNVGITSAGVHTLESARRIACRLAYEDANNPRTRIKLHTGGYFDPLRTNPSDAVLEAATPLQNAFKPAAERQTIPLSGTDGNEWYFDCDGHYIDVMRAADGTYSVFFFNRGDGTTAWLAQSKEGK